MEESYGSIFDLINDPISEKSFDSNSNFSEIIKAVVPKDIDFGLEFDPKDVLKTPIPEIQGTPLDKEIVVPKLIKVLESSSCQAEPTSETAVGANQSVMHNSNATKVKFIPLILKKSLRNEEKEKPKESKCSKVISRLKENSITANRNLQKPVLTTTITKVFDTEATSTSADNSKEKDTEHKILQANSNAKVLEWFKRNNSNQKEGEKQNKKTNVQTKIKSITSKKKSKKSKASLRRKRKNYKDNLKNRVELKTTQFKAKATRLMNRTIKLINKGIELSKEMATIVTSKDQPIEGWEQMTFEQKKNTIKNIQDNRVFFKRAQQTANHLHAYEVLAKNPSIGESFKDIPPLTEEEADKKALKLYCLKKF